MVKYRITREVIDSRRKKMTTTSYARFDAHKRCERLNNSSLFALTSTSLLLIYIGILNNYLLPTCPFINPEYLEIFSTFASVVILALSLVVAFASYSLKSERFFRSGNEIKTLCDRLEIIHESETETFLKIQSQYTHIIKNSDNHQSHNYKKGRLERKVQDGDTLDGNEFGNRDFISYWAPIVSFYLLTTLSFVTFVYITCKYIANA